MSRMPSVSKNFLDDKKAPSVAIQLFDEMKQLMVRIKDFYEKVAGDRWSQEISIWLFAQPEFVEYFAKRATSLPEMYLGMALEKMARKAQYEDIKKYIDAGYKPVGHGCRQLMQGAAEGNDVRIGKLFLDTGVDVNENHGNSMNIANIYGSIDMARFLLESGIESRAHALRTLAMIELFVEFGVDPEKYVNQTLVLAPYYEESMEMIKRLLLIEGVDINHESGRILQVSAECGKSDEAKLIIENGFDLLKYGPEAVKTAIDNEQFAVGELIANYLHRSLAKKLKN